jgi:hypothetical protein
VVLLSFLGLIIFDWVFLTRFEALLRNRPDDPALLLMQQQIDQLCLQFSQILDNSTRVIQHELGQVPGAS